MGSVTKAMPFQFIDGNILKSCKTGLTNHTQPISHHIMPLVINALSGGQTERQTDRQTDRQTHTHIPMHEQKQFQETGHAWLQAACTWFKKGVEIAIKSKETSSKL